MIIDESTFGFDPRDRDGAIDFLIGGLDRQAEARRYDKARQEADAARLEALKALDAIGTRTNPEQPGEDDQAALAALFGLTDEDDAEATE